MVITYTIPISRIMFEGKALFSIEKHGLCSARNPNSRNTLKLKTEAE